MARRYKSLHHNLQPGENVVYHREHRSPRNRRKNKLTTMSEYNREKRREWKVKQHYDQILRSIVGKRRKNT